MPAESSTQYSLAEQLDVVHGRQFELALLERRLAHVLYLLNERQHHQQRSREGDEHSREVERQVIAASDIIHPAWNKKYSLIVLVEDKLFHLQIN